MNTKSRHMIKTAGNPNIVYEDLSIEILKEHLRQVRWTANVAISGTAGATILSLVGCGLLLMGKVQEGTVTTAIGFLSSMCCVQTSRESSDRLERLIESLKSSENCD